MAPSLRHSQGLMGVATVAFALWQWVVNSREETTTSKVEDGRIEWARPGWVPPLGSDPTYISPRERITFETQIRYPDSVYTGQAFQILLESRSAEIVAPDGESSRSWQEERVWRILADAHHSFELELPGLEFSPRGANTFRVDDKGRWQVAPAREPAVFKGYIRPRGGTAEVLGADYLVS